MDERQIYSEQFKIRASEVNSNGKAKLESICELLQETAGNHALQLNFDISQLKDKNLTWVLHRLHVQMDQFPKWRDAITIKTWPSSGDTLRAYRDFLILNAEGEELGRCLSYWLMMDTGSRRPIRMPDEILEMAPRNIDHVLEIKKERISIARELSCKKNFTVRRSDLDLNHHVNNVHYIEWALEALPEDAKACEIDIEFRSECTINQAIESCIARKENAESSRLHQLVRTNDEKVVAVGTSRT